MPEYVIVSAQSPTATVPLSPEILHDENGEPVQNESGTFVELEGNVDP